MTPKRDYQALPSCVGCKRVDTWFLCGYRCPCRRTCGRMPQGSSTSSPRPPGSLVCQAYLSRGLTRDGHIPKYARNRILVSPEASRHYLCMGPQTPTGASPDLCRHSEAPGKNRVSVDQKYRCCVLTSEITSQRDRAKSSRAEHIVCVTLASKNVSTVALPPLVALTPLDMPMPVG